MKTLTYLLLFLPSLCFAQQFTYNQGGTPAKKYYEEIPYESINGKLFLNVTIGDKRHRFLFDTGAPVAVSKELAAELKAPVIHKDLIHDAYLNKDSITVVELSGLQLGGIVFDHIPAITLFPDVYKCYQIDGVIGSNLLRNSIVSIVSSKHIIILTDQRNKLDLKAKNSNDLVSADGIQSDPQIRIVMKDKLNLNIPFDTGDSEFLRMNDRMVTQLKQYALFDTLTTGYGANNMSALGLQVAAPKCLYKVAFFNVGNGRFNNLVAESNKDALPAIGSKLLDYGSVTLDFINHRFYFDANAPVNDLGEKQWPFKAAFVDNKLVVGTVWQKGRDILKQGEQITAIDDKDCSHITLCDLVNSKPQLYGKESAVLTITDDKGASRKVDVKRE